MFRCSLRSIVSRTSASRLSIRTLSTHTKPYKVLCFPGDGIGTEIVNAARTVLAATGVPIEWTDMDMGFDTMQRTGQPIITENHLKTFEKFRVLFKGPQTVPPASAAAYITIRGRKFTSANQALRKLYNLNANIRPAKSVPGVKTPFPNVNVVVVRENTEDLYTGEEKWVNSDTCEAIKRITRKASTKIAETAFDFAVRNGRKRVTAVHKANVCKQSDGLFLACAQAVAKKYPQIKFDDQLADSLLTKMVQDPSPYDILLCPNMFGDLISDFCAGLIGSLGLCPSGQFGDNYAVFEPSHGSAPDIAGRGIANPISQVRCGSMLLEYLGEKEAAARVDAAVVKALDDPQNLTCDLGGKATTAKLTQAIIDRL